MRTSSRPAAARPQTENLSPARQTRVQLLAPSTVASAIRNRKMTHFPSRGAAAPAPSVELLARELPNARSTGCLDLIEPAHVARQAEAVSLAATSGPRPPYKLTPQRANLRVCGAGRLLRPPTTAHCSELHNFQPFLGTARLRRNRRQMRSLDYETKMQRSGEPSVARIPEGKRFRGVKMRRRPAAG